VGTNAIMLRKASIGVLLVFTACAVGEPGPRGVGVPIHEVEPGADEDEGPVDDRKVHVAEHAPPPLSGGTLLVTSTGDRAVVSDPDRDSLHVLDLVEGAKIGSIALDEGAQPGRLVEDSRGLVHVALRRSGTVVVIDPQAAELVEAREVCAEPRGLAIDPATETMHVACASGTLLAYPVAGGPEVETYVEVYIEGDLRDVFFDGSIHVSKFRRAEVIDLDAQLIAGQRVAAPDLEVFGSSLGANTAWRTVASPDGGWLMLHQSSDNQPIDPSGTGTEYYVGANCPGVVSTTVTKLTAEGEILSSGPLRGVVLAIDVAIAPDGNTIALAVAGQSEPKSPTQTTQRDVVVLSTGALVEDPEGCTDAADVEVPGQPVAVAFTPGGTLVVQTREPAAVHLVAPLLADELVTIALASDAVEDTGHSMFHQDAGGGIACASCHPEGGDDGRVWRFVDIGHRRTLPLDVGLRGTEPFHWAGDLEDFDVLVEEVHTRGMGALTQSPERADALAEWVFAVPQPFPFESSAPDAVRRGRDLFTAYACNGCHRGDAFTSNETVQVGDEMLQVPSLRGLIYRAPYMHDGRAKTLEAAVREMVETFSPTDAPTLTDAVLDDLVAYTESL
jgi:hypothetical protein